MQKKTLPLAVATGLFALASVNVAMASSHREAPSIAGMPKVDGTDFYMFRSYETDPVDRSDFVTFIANYIPLQDAYGGPNYFTLDPKALYEIHIDNDGDSVEDISFQFRPNVQYNNIAIPTAQDEGSTTQMTTIPLVNSSPDGIGPNVTNVTGLNVRETYQVTVARDGRRSKAQPTSASRTNGSTTFNKPVDNIGEKSINGDYGTYSLNHVQDIRVPGCATNGRVFVGQRKEGFVINLGEVFDLVNTDPTGARDGEANIINDKNVTSLALELPISCLTANNDPVIGAWTTASVRQSRVLNPNPQSALTDTTREGGAWTQVSRLGMPLTNEVVIGIDKKDLFNSSEPKDDLGNFGAFVLRPTLPVLLNALFGVDVPATPRNDLVATFVTGIPGLNQSANLTVPGEMLRLNTSIAVTPPASQNDLGAAAGDNAGFPNGRRPYDDVVDVSLAAVVGFLCGFDAAGSTMDCGNQDSQQNGGLVPTDGASSPGPTAATSTVTGQQFANDTYLDVFPYLNNPIGGSPNTDTDS